MTKYVCPKIVSVGNKDHNVGVVAAVNAVAVRSAAIALAVAVASAVYVTLAVTKDDTAH